MFASGREHHRERAQDPSGPVTGAGRHELAEPLFAQAAEPEGIDEVAQDFRAGVGDQRLAGESDRNGRECTGRIRHRKGAPSLGEITASTTTIFPAQSTLPLFKHAPMNATS